MSVANDIRAYLASGPRWSGPPESLGLQYPLIDNEVLDSLGIFELVGFIEDEFDIDVQDDDLVPENFENVEAISQLVERRQAG